MDQPIFGHGPPGSIFFIEDYPTEEEFSSKKPLHGSTANLIRKLFRPSNYDINNCYKTVFCKERTPLQTLIRKGKIKYRSKLQLQYKEWFNQQETLLLQELLEIQPSVIICAGELPLNFLCERRKIHKFRGSPLQITDWIRLKYPILDKTIVIPILPLRNIFPNPNFQIFTQWDLSRAVQFTKESFRHPDTKYRLYVCRTSGALYDFLSHCPKPEFRTIDIETQNGLITCIGICNDGLEAISVPLLDLPKDEVPYVWKALAKYLEKPIPTVNQNIWYDDYHCNKYGFRINNIVGDTMYVANIIYPEFPKGLDFLTSIYTDFEYYKDDVKDVSGINFDPDKYHDRLYIYNAKDALVTHLIWPLQTQDAKELGVWNFYQKRTWPLYHIYKKISSRGVLIDESKRTQLLEKYTSFFSTSLSYIQDTIGEIEGINWSKFTNSPRQVAKLIYDELGCPSTYHIVEDQMTGERRKVLSTDEDTLEDLIINKLENEAVKQIVSTVILLRKLYKIIGFLSTPYCPDGRMRTSYNVVGTKSGRTSASERPDFVLRLDDKELFKKEEIGYSFQTIPRRGHELPDGSIIGNDIMEIYVPSPGYVFIEGDKSQAESRVSTILANNFDFLSFFDKPPGVHRLTASWIYNCSPESVKKNTPPYEYGKRVRHAGTYGMGPYRLSLMIHRAFKECELLLYKFHRADPSIQDVFHRDIKDALNKNKTLITPFERKRIFYGKLDDSTYKEAISYIPQSTVSDDLKFCMCQLNEAAPWAHIFAEKHDSVTSEVPRERVEEYKEIWDKIMQQPIDFRKCTLSRDIEYIIPTELSIGEENWGNMKGI